MTTIVSTMTGSLRDQLKTFFDTVQAAGGLGDQVRAEYESLAVALESATPVVTDQATTGFTQEVRDSSAIS